MDLPNPAWAVRGIDKQTTRKRIWRRYQDKTKVKYHDNYSTAFGVVTRIRPVIIITFGTANFVVLNSITLALASVLVVVTLIL